MESIRPPSQEFTKLSADYDRVKDDSLAEYLIYLSSFVGLTPRELTYAIALKVMSNVSRDMGLKILEGLADGEELVCAYARAILASPPDAESPLAD